MAAKVAGQGDTPKRLGEAVKRFCRSIELCDDYLRGYYGLKLVSMQAFRVRRGSGICLTISERPPPSC